MRMPVENTIRQRRIADLLVPGVLTLGDLRRGPRAESAHALNARANRGERIHHWRGERGSLFSEANNLFRFSSMTSIRSRQANKGSHHSAAS